MRASLADLFNGTSGRHELGAFFVHGIAQPFATQNLKDDDLRSLARFAFAFSCQAVVVNGITNGFLVRTSPAWYLSMSLGLAYGLGSLAREEQRVTPLRPRPLRHRSHRVRLPSPD